MAFCVLRTRHLLFCIISQVIWRFNRATWLCFCMLPWRTLLVTTHPFRKHTLQRAVSVRLDLMLSRSSQSLWTSHLLWLWVTHGAELNVYKSHMENWPVISIIMTSMSDRAVERKEENLYVHERDATLLAKLGYRSEFRRDFSVEDKGDSREKADPQF